MALKFYNTATRTLEEFTPLPPYEVKMYNCGPTVYDFAQIGNLRSYVFADVLRRTLEMNGYTVKQVVNITDVGHLVSDADDGEDKIVLGAQREGKNIEDIIKLYSDAFYADLRTLNILPALKYPRATQYINEQKGLIETLHKKGFLYTTNDGVYFDTSKFPRYGDFARLDMTGMQAGTRVEMREKKLRTDFAVWKFSPEDGRKREQEWDSPLGIGRKGFPGWHVECSAIAMKELGETIDIHTGGVDHIPVHHTNEIAQSESATGKPFVRFWLHNAFVLVNGKKMSKSLGNVYRLRDIEGQHISPVAYRYWLLTARYRTEVNFTWESLKGSDIAYQRLCALIVNLGDNIGTANKKYHKRFIEHLNDDLNTPSAIALMWDLLKDADIAKEDKLATMFAFDKVFGLGLKEGHDLFAAHPMGVPPPVLELCNARARARGEKNWAEADRLRDEISKLGYEVKDTPEGSAIVPL